MTLSDVFYFKVSNLENISYYIRFLLIMIYISKLEFYLEIEINSQIWEWVIRYNLRIQMDVDCSDEWPGLFCELFD